MVLYFPKNYHFCVGVTVVTVKVTNCNQQNTSDCYSSNNATISDHTLATTITLPSHMQFTTHALLQYDSGQRFESQNDIVVSELLFSLQHECAFTIGTHDLQNVKIDFTVDNLCLHFQFVKGSTTNAAHLQFVSVYYSYSILYGVTILRYDRLNFTECITTLPANNWTLYACDELPCTLNPAVTITDIVISVEQASFTFRPANTEVEPNSYQTRLASHQGSCTDTIFLMTPCVATWTSFDPCIDSTSLGHLIVSTGQSFENTGIRSTNTYGIFESNKNNVFSASGKC